MKHVLFPVITSLLFVVCSSSAFAETTIEKVTLKGGESKTFSIEAQSKTKIGFKPTLSSEEARKCENNCIELTQIGGTSFASMYGGAMGMTPQDGKIEVALKNVETFPIEVELYQK